MANADAVARKLSGIPSVSTMTARFVQANPDGTVLVDFGQGSVQVYSAGFYTPLPGDYVRTVKIDTLTLMLGPVAPRSAYGRVTATGSPLLTVLLSDESSVQLPYVTTYASPAVNDDVLISWADGGMVIGPVTQVPLSDYLPPAPASPAGGGSFSADFRAEDSGTQNTGSAQWWTGDIWCGSTTTGAWFYGSQIADTIPDGAAITAVRVWTPEFYNAYPGSLATIGLHGLGSKSGVAAVSSAVQVLDGTGWKVLPNAFADALKTGSKLGIGTNHGGYHKYVARSRDPQSGLLHIEWSI